LLYGYQFDWQLAENEKKTSGIHLPQWLSTEPRRHVGGILSVKFGNLNLMLFGLVCATASDHFVKQEQWER